MPELPECERARKDLEGVAKGKTISKVTATVDDIVFSGISPASLKAQLEGKIVKDVRRKGKNFYLVLSSAPSPIFHFGMSGTAHIRGTATATYRVPRGQTEENEVWPPKYCKMIIEFSDEKGTVTDEWAYCDARRLGRIKLVHAEVPEEAEPLVSLGADPLLNMPTVEELTFAFGKRNAPIKAVLLDQNGPVCGVGNWMADEILFQARIHPSQITSSLTSEQVTTLHHHIHNVTATAVAVNADASAFPSHWIFSSRWNKGKKDSSFVILPSGEKEVIKFITVAGRTSAVVLAVQKLVGVSTVAKAKEAMKEAGDKPKTSTPTKKRKAKDEEAPSEDTTKSPYFKEEDNVTSPHFSPVASASTGRKSTRRKLEGS